MVFILGTQRWLKCNEHISAAAAKSLQSCPTLCDPIDGSPPGSPSLGFSRQEHWSGLPFHSPMHESEKWKVKVKSLSRVRFFETPWTAAYQAPLSMGFCRQEYWSGVPFPSPVPRGGSYLSYLQVFGLLWSWISRTWSISKINWILAFRHWNIFALSE